MLRSLTERFDANRLRERESECCPLRLARTNAVWPDRIYVDTETRYLHASVAFVASVPSCLAFTFVFLGASVSLW